MKSLMSLSKGWKRIFCCKFFCFPISKLTRKQLNVPTLRFSFEFSWSWLKASSRTTRGNRANIREFKLADSGVYEGLEETLWKVENTHAHIYMYTLHTKNVCFGLYLQLSRHFNARRKLMISTIDVYVTPCNFRLLCFGLLQFDTNSCYAQRLEKRLLKLILEMLIASEDCECPVTEGKYGEPAWWRSGQLWHICHCGKRRGEIQQRFKFQTLTTKTEWRWCLVRTQTGQRGRCRRWWRWA